MLFAQVDVDSKAYQAGLVAGHITIVIVCLAVPIAAGFKCQKPVLGIIGGVMSGAFAIPSGWLCGFPLAVIWVIVILCVANLNIAAPHRRRRRRKRRDDDDVRRPPRRRKRLDEVEDEEDERQRRKATSHSDDGLPSRRRLSDGEYDDDRSRRRRYSDD